MKARTPDAEDPPLANLQYVQLVYASNPPKGATGPFIDPFGGNGDGTPFYYSKAEDQGAKAGGTYGFSDSPDSPWPSPPTASLTADFILFLAYWNDQSKSMTVYDGVFWGFYFANYPNQSLSPSDRGALSAVPEPSGPLMMLIGSALVVGLRVRSAHVRAKSRDIKGLERMGE